MHARDIGIYNRPKSYINMPIKRSHAASYLLGLAMFAQSVYENLTFEVYINLTLIIIVPAKIDCKYANLILEIAIFVLSVTVCQIIT